MKQTFWIKKKKAKNNKPTNNQTEETTGKCYFSFLKIAACK